MKKKSTLPTSYVHAQVAGDGFLMTAAYDSAGRQVELIIKGDPAAVVGHLMKAFKGTAPLLGALVSELPKTDREIAQETITEQNQRRNPSLRENPKKNSSRNSPKTPGKPRFAARRHQK